MSNAKSRKAPPGERGTFPLIGFRAAAKKTQVEVAVASGMQQGDVSRLERRGDLDDVLVSTLRRYVEATGGRLELVAVRGSHRVVLNGADGVIPLRLDLPSHWFITSTTGEVFPWPTPTLTLTPTLTRLLNRTRTRTRTPRRRTALRS